uniref:Peroxisomal membrane protein PMP22 n=1 Tax=Fagus sylvatica TaxID=28930 RepID=A0A2N9H9N8_FAGSY
MSERKEFAIIHSQNLKELEAKIEHRVDGKEGFVESVLVAASTSSTENKGISDLVSQKLTGIQKIQLRRLILKVVLLEQLTSSPWNNLLFLAYYGLIIEGRPWMQVKTKIKKDYPSVQLTAWTFWPVAGWINHQYVPLQFRVIFHSFVAFGWGIFLNLRARSLALTKAK